MSCPFVTRNLLDLSLPLPFFFPAVVSLFIFSCEGKVLQHVYFSIASRAKHFPIRGGARALLGIMTGIYGEASQDRRKFIRLVPIVFHDREEEEGKEGTNKRTERSPSPCVP